MATMYRYQLPVTETGWTLQGETQTAFTWEYEDERIVPTVKDIGLWGDRVQKAFADMGAIEFASIDSDALLEQDNRVAEDFDAGRFVRDSL